MDQPWVYIVLLGLVLVVYARMLPKPSSAQQSASVKEIEETMEHFAAELDEQNQAVIQLFSETRQTYESHLAKLTSRIEWLEKQQAGSAQDIARLQATVVQLEKQLAAQAFRTQADKPFAEANESKPAPAAIQAQSTAPAEQPERPAPLMNIQERYTDVFQLHRQGKSTDYIAKKLGMNKGEINLIIQLAKQEENLRA